MRFHQGRVAFLLRQIRFRAAGYELRQFRRRAGGLISSSPRRIVPPGCRRDAGPGQRSVADWLVTSSSLGMGGRLWPALQPRRRQSTNSSKRQPIPQTQYHRRRGSSSSNATVILAKASKCKTPQIIPTLKPCGRRRWRLLPRVSWTPLVREIQTTRSPSDTAIRTVGGRA